MYYLTNTETVPGIRERVAQAAFEAEMPIRFHEDPIPEDNDPEFEHYSFERVKAEGYGSIVLEGHYVRDCSEFWEIMSELEDPQVCNQSVEKVANVINVYAARAAECYADIEYARTKYWKFQYPQYVGTIMKMSRRLYARARFLRGVTDADQNYA